MTVQAGLKKQQIVRVSLARVLLPARGPSVVGAVARVFVSVGSPRAQYTGDCTLFSRARADGGGAGTSVASSGPHSLEPSDGGDGGDASATLPQELLGWQLIYRGKEVSAGIARRGFVMSVGRECRSMHPVCVCVCTPCLPHTHTHRHAPRPRPVNRASPCLQLWRSAETRRSCCGNKRVLQRL